MDETKNEPEVEEVAEIEEVYDEEGNDTTDWKALALKNQGIAKRFKTKSEKISKERDEFKSQIPPKEEKKQEPDKPEKSSELDYGQLAFHNTKSDAVKIEHEEDIEYLKNTLTDTKKPQKELLAAKWFLAELKERQEQRAIKEATPPASSRGSAPSSKTQVDYWLDKPFEEVPPDMREAVLNAKLEREKRETMFSNNPVIKSPSDYKG